MVKEEYTDISLTSAKYITKYTGIWLPRNRAEKCQQIISLSCMASAFIISIYVNTLNAYRSSGDLAHCLLSIINLACMSMAMGKLFFFHARRVEFADVLSYARKYFWHYNYDSKEQQIFFTYVKYCRWLIYFAFLVPPASLSGYVITPLIENYGRNKSDRVLPFKMWVDWPLTETPYYELMFMFQVVCVFLIGVAYICPDTFLCILNVHVMGQFRMLQYKLLSSWNTKGVETDTMKYAEQCYATLKKCVQRHQLLIKFCEKLENVYTMSIFVHMAMLSIIMGIDCYEILLADAPASVRFIFIFHIIGSFIHLFIFTYTCDGIMEESVNISTTLYQVSWSSLPMNRIGKTLRRNIGLIMSRSLKPCCLTAGGFFPVSLQTFTALISSAFSYFTLMRESFLRSENE